MTLKNLLLVSILCCYLPVAASNKKTEQYKVLDKDLPLTERNGATVALTVVGLTGLYGLATGLAQTPSAPFTHGLCNGLYYAIASYPAAALLGLGVTEYTFFNKEGKEVTEAIVNGKKIPLAKPLADLVINKMVVPMIGTAAAIHIGTTLLKSYLPSPVSGASQLFSNALATTGPLILAFFLINTRAQNAKKAKKALIAEINALKKQAQKNA